MNIITSKFSRTLAASAILSALAVGFASVSSAGEADAAPQAIVKYGDLNPKSALGAEVLYGRIYHAAEDVCSRMYISTEAYRHYKYACLRKVIADAVTRVDEPALSAVSASKNGTSAPVVLAAAGTR